MSDADLRLPFACVEPMPELDQAIHVWSLATGARDTRDVRATARAALDRLLRHYAGDAAFTIETGRHGKPFVGGSPWLQFNVSHAGTHAVFAFARDQALGIDIEPGDRRVSVDGVSERFFSAYETAALARVDPARRRDAFLQLWTRKEAVLKALGAGLGFGLDRVEFDLAADGEAGPMREIASEAGRPDEWQVLRFTPAAGLLGSLAWCGRPRAVQLFHLSR